MELKSFKKELKLIFIEMFDDVFVVSYVYCYFFIGSIVIVFLYKLLISYVVILIELIKDCFRS